MMIPNELMAGNGVLTGAIGLLAGAGIRSVVLMGVVLLALPLLQRASAATRHAVVGAGLVASLAIPLIMLLPWELPLLPAALPSIDRASTVAVGGAGPAAPAVRTPLVEDEVAEVAEPRVGTGEASEVGRAELVAAGASAGGGNGVPLTTLLIGVWALGLALVGGRMFVSQLRAGRLVRSSHPVSDGPWQRLLWESADRLEIGSDVRLLRNADVNIAFAAGALEPAIVVPSAGDEWEEDRRRAVLMHELAHIRRRDLLLHHASRVACAFYWYNPLVWLGARRLRAESERAADDMVLGVGTRPSDYADHILQIVTETGRSAMPTPVLTFARRRELEGRIVAILEPHSSRRILNRRQLGMVAGAIAIFALPLAALTPSTDAPDLASAYAAEIESNRAADSADDMRVALDRLARSDALIPDADARPDPRPNAAPDPDGSVNVHVDTHTDVDVDLDENNSLAELILGEVDGQVRSRLGVIQALATQDDDDPRAIAALIELLRNDEVADVRRAAAFGLGEMEAREAIPALSEALTGDPDDRVREAAAMALGEIEDRGAVDALMVAMDDDNVRVRRVAMAALADLEEVAAAGRFAEALSDPDAVTRRWAAYALGELNLDRAPPELIAAVNDSEPQVRAAVVHALGEIEDPAAIQALQTAVRDASPNVRQMAIWALGEIANDDAIAGLSIALDDEDPRVRMMAIYGLGETGSDAALALVADAFDDPDPDVRRAAVMAVGEIDSEAGIALLLRALEDPDPEVREMAAQAIADL